VLQKRKITSEHPRNKTRITEQQQCNDDNRQRATETQGL